MKGYKAFNKGLNCRGKQYAENTVFEEKNAEFYKCSIFDKNRMYFCQNPLDVLSYHPLVDNEGNVAEFTEVEALDDVRTDDGKEFCTKKLKIGSKLSLSQFIEAIFDFASQNIKSQAEVSDGETLIGGGYAELMGNDWVKLIGDNDATLAGGKNTIIVGDDGSTAKGKKGSIIVLVERNDSLSIVNFKAVQVDGEKIKEDVLYKLENGEFVEVEE